MVMPMDGPESLRENENEIRSGFQHSIFWLMSLPAAQSRKQVQLSATLPCSMAPFLFHSI
jgi:hypothetical protein